MARSPPTCGASCLRIRAAPSKRSRLPSTPRSTTSSSSRLKPLQRSEEHTSELQSHSDLVCRLLLEKKKILSRNIVPTMNKDLLRQETAGENADGIRRKPLIRP